MLRIVVLALAFMAAAKVWTQDTLFRAGAEEALIAAYRDRAVQACQRIPGGRTGTEAGSSAPVTWSRSASMRMKTGSTSAGVYFWQVDHALWNSRFRNPYLVISAGDRAPAVECEFDILFGTAIVMRG